jgi:hypothetical protein
MRPFLDACGLDVPSSFSVRVRADMKLAYGHVVPEETAAESAAASGALFAQVFIYLFVRYWPLYFGLCFPHLMSEHSTRPRVYIEFFNLVCTSGTTQLLCF